MAYGYKHVSPTQLCNIVERLTSPTQASISWRHDYDAQATHVSYLKLRDPLVHPQRNVNTDQLGHIVQRLTRPTTASTAATWDFDNQDANLLYLRKVDRNIRLPLKTMSPTTNMSSWTSRSSSRRSRISVEDNPGGQRAESGTWQISHSSYTHSGSDKAGHRKRMLPTVSAHSLRDGGKAASSDEETDSEAGVRGHSGARSHNYQEASSNLVAVS